MNQCLETEKLEIMKYCFVEFQGLSLFYASKILSPGSTNFLATHSVV